MARTGWGLSYPATFFACALIFACRFFAPLAIAARPAEKKEFDEYGKALWTFLSGYVLAKTGAIFDQGLKSGDLRMVFVRYWLACPADQME